MKKPGEFDLEELFFSRSDRRGTILYSNDVFTRVSGFSQDELVGQPHKVVRHPQMPSALFQILWDRNERGLATCGYFCYRTKTGDPYWLFAAVTPLEDGYLSVRFKPTSPLFRTVQTMYEDAFQREDKQGQTPEQSAEALTKALKELGYADFDSVMGDVLTKECQARNAGLGRPADPTLAALERLHNTCLLIEAECERIFANRQSIALASVNLRLSASGFGDRGRSIGVIAENFAKVTADLMAHLTALTEVLRRCRETVSEARTLSGIRAIQTEMADKFRTEAEVPADSVRMLERQQERYADHAREGLQKVARDAATVPKLCSDLRRSLLGLAMVRVMCKMEVAALSAGSDGATSMVVMLEKFVENSNQRVTAIQNHLPTLRGDLDSLGAGNIVWAA